MKMVHLQTVTDSFGKCNKNVEKLSQVLLGVVKVRRISIYAFITFISTKSEKLLFHRLLS